MSVSCLNKKAPDGVRTSSFNHRIPGLMILIVLFGLSIALAGCREDSDANQVSYANQASDGSIYVDTQIASDVNGQPGQNNKVQQIVIETVRENDSDDTIWEETATNESASKETVSNETETAEAVEDVEAVETVEAGTYEAPVIQNVTPGSVTEVAFNPGWTYGSFSAINSGKAKLYAAADNRKNIVIGVNAGHGTKGGQSVKTYCHPDMSPKVTGGTTSAGATMAVAVSGGMTFADGTSEASVTLRMAQIFRDKLLQAGYDVLMLRDDSDVQLDNVARTLIANNNASCIISIHWDGDNLDYDKGCFYISTPDGIKGMQPVATYWQQHETLGKSLISGLLENGSKIYKNGSMSVDLTQTSFSTVPSVDIELGNAASNHDDATLSKLADGLVTGVKKLY